MRPEDDPDVQRMLAVRAGDPGAYEDLYKKYAQSVVRFAMQFVGSQARAEEIAQDVFLQVYRTRKSYEPRARFATWLFRIAANASLSELRRPERRRRSLSLSAPNPATERETPMELPDPRSAEGEATASGEELQQRIKGILSQLPGQQRAALLLARAEGFSYDEVAESLGCTIPAVKSLIHRATVTLRAGLRDYIGEDA